MVIGVKWFVDLMLCCGGWLDFSVIGGHGVGDVGLLFHFFGDWCVEEMWGGGHGVVILGIVVD